MIAKVLTVLILFLAVLAPKSYAFTPTGQGVFSVSSCSSIQSPVNGSTWCLLSNSNPPQLYQYLNNTYTAMTTQIIGGGATLNFTSSPPIVTGVCLNGNFSTRCYGAKGDTNYQISAGSNSGTTFTRADGGSFTATDPGKTLILDTAGPNGNAYQGLISAFVNSTQVTLNTAPTANVSNQRWAYGTDDTVNVQKCLTAAGDASGDCKIDHGNYLITSPLFLGDPVSMATSAGAYVLHTTQIGTGNGSTTTFTATLSTPLQRDATFVWANQLTSGPGRIVYVDEEEAGTGTNQGVFRRYNNSVDGTINYTTGALTITFPSPVTSGATVSVSYYTVPSGAGPFQVNGESGLVGSGTFSSYLILAPSITSYGVTGFNEFGKRWSNFNIDPALSSYSSLPFGGLAVPITNGAPNTQDFIQNIISRQSLVAFDLDLQNDSLIEGDSALNINNFSKGGAFYSTFANGNGGPMMLIDLDASSPVEAIGQNLGIYSSGLYGGLRIWSAQTGATINIENTQVFPDPLDNTGIDTITGGCNFGTAQSLNLISDWFAGTTGGAISGHWWSGGSISGTQFTSGPVFGTLGGDTCGTNKPYFSFVGSSNSGTMGSSNSLVHWSWCNDGNFNCAYNYDNIAGTGTQFLGTGTPNAPFVTLTGSGSTSYSYYQVDVGRNGLDSPPSTTATTVTNSTLNSTTNFNTICPVYNSGATQYRILKTNTNTLLGTIDNAGWTQTGSGATAACLVDTGQGTSAYTPNTIDQTSYVNPNNPLTVGYSLGIKKGSGVANAGGSSCQLYVTQGTGSACNLNLQCGTGSAVAIVSNSGSGC